ncbi:RNA polymerase sigma factor [Aquimarina agarilytica]|uniref:RNA polymerase sigma factor n=1 Tax=Aquimarina agarilytica TaxID=1087449 RepID=UPI000289993B|nr:RNA polymerase sigma factor [Aquimarina agarilytica]
MEKDQSLITLLKDKKQKNIAFKMLLDTYQKRLYWHIRKLVLIHEDANDVLQNTYLKIYKNIDSFKGNSSIHTWMYRIAYNESIDFLKAKQKRLKLSSEEINTKILEALKEDVYFEGDQIQFKLQEALLKLPEKQKQVFVMKYYDDLKFKEISEIIGTSEGALKASYHHAVKKIERFLIQ